LRVCVCERLEKQEREREPERWVANYGGLWRWPF
jgi:hypothetical protein